MNESAPKLTAKQEIAALSLAMGGRIAEAAQAAKVKPRTVKAWLAMVPEFKKRIGELRSEMTERCLATLCRNAASAANTLAFLSRKGAAERSRIAAAKAVLDSLLRFREQTELAERLTAIEEQLAARPTGNRRGRVA